MFSIAGLLVMLVLALSYVVWLLPRELAVTRLHEVIECYGYSGE